MNPYYHSFWDILYSAVYMRINIIANQCMEFGLIAFELNNLEFKVETTNFSLSIHIIVLQNVLSLTITSP